MFALFCLCVSCKTQQITPEQKSEYQEALASLRSGCFIVQLDALYPRPPVRLRLPSPNTKR